MHAMINKETVYELIWQGIKNECLHIPADSVFRSIQQARIAINMVMLVSNKGKARASSNAEEVQLDKIINYSNVYNQKIIEYYFSGETSLVVTVQSGKFSITRFIPESQMREKIQGYVSYIASQGLPREMVYIKAKGLYRELLAPYMNIDKKIISNILIIPAGCLCAFPFETLVTGGTASEPEYLIQNANITYLESISIALTLDEKRIMKREHTFDFVAFGDPKQMNKRANMREKESIFKRDVIQLSRLPRSRKEVVSIGKRFKSNKRVVLVGANANEESFRNLSGISTKILHVACHSIIDYENPQNTRLMLSPTISSAYDGNIKVSEIYESKYPISLVVLSSCQSARGNTDNREGVLGFSRAFFISGTLATIVTLWRIEDRAASLFVKLLYKNMFIEKSLASAVRSAKIAMLRTRYRHPAFWASYVLNGGIGVSI